MTTQDVNLSVVESDQPTVVRMFNSLGCEIGNWTLEEWIEAITKSDIVLQIGDRFELGE